MSTPRASAADAPRMAITDCWNKIGVRGDSSCPELEQYIHCRNCPVYSAAAVHLLDVEPPTGYMARWTEQVAQKNQLTEVATHSVVVFRVGAEWLALPTAVLKEVVSMRPIHSLPHRRSGVVLGLANIRGELLVCFSLQHALGLEPAAEPKREKLGAGAERLLVIERDGNRAVCPVEEVHGIARFHPGEVTPAPTTVAKSSTAHSRSVLTWQQRSVGLLDDQSLLHAVNRSLA